MNFGSRKLNLFRTVGTGSFGRVMVCNERDSENFLAVKCLSKDCIMEKEQVRSFLDSLCSLLCSAIVTHYMAHLKSMFDLADLLPILVVVIHISYNSKLYFILT